MGDTEETELPPTNPPPEAPAEEAAPEQLEEPLPPWGAIGEEAVTEAAKAAYQSYGATVGYKHDKHDANEPMYPWVDLSQAQKDAWMNAAFTILSLPPDEPETVETTP